MSTILRALRRLERDRARVPVTNLQERVTEGEPVVAPAEPRGALGVAAFVAAGLVAGLVLAGGFYWAGRSAAGAEQIVEQTGEQPAGPTVAAAAPGVAPVAQPAASRAPLPAVAAAPSLPAGVVARPARAARVPGVAPGADPDLRQRIAQAAPLDAAPLRARVPSPAPPSPVHKAVPKPRVVRKAAEAAAAESIAKPRRPEPAEVIARAKPGASSQVVVERRGPPPSEEIGARVSNAPVAQVVRHRTPDFAVQSTVWHPGRERRLATLAFFDGEAKTERVLREGESAEGMLVLEITPSEVVLFHEGQELRRRVGSRAGR